MFLLIILIFIIIHIKFGLLVLISIILWFIIFLLSNFLLGLNPNNKEMFIIRILSILIIIFILYYNSLEYTIISSFIIPLSVTKFTFLNDILNDEESNRLDIICIRKPDFKWFNFCDFKDIMNLLSTFEDNKAYIATFDLIIDQSGYESGDPSLLLGLPILINKNSNPWLISEYVTEQVVKAINSYNLEENTEVSILVKHKEIRIFWD
jgi:hypothetical protein